MQYKYVLHFCYIMKQGIFRKKSNWLCKTKFWSSLGTIKRFKLIYYVSCDKFIALITQKLYYHFLNGLSCVTTFFF